MGNNPLSPPLWKIAGPAGKGSECFPTYYLPFTKHGVEEKVNIIARKHSIPIVNLGNLV